MSRIIARLTSVALCVPATLTATTNGAAVDVSRFTGIAKAILDASAAGDAAGETADVKLQHSVDGSTNWADVPGAAFTQVTNAAGAHQAVMLNTDSLHKYVRVVTTMAGTSPSVTRSVSLVGTLAY